MYIVLYTVSSLIKSSMHDETCPVQSSIMTEASVGEIYQIDSHFILNYI